MAGSAAAAAGDGVRAERRQGDIYYGLWYPIYRGDGRAVIGVFFLRDTRGTHLDAVNVK